jgi:chromosome segregation ATPase
MSTTEEIKQKIIETFSKTLGAVLEESVRSGDLIIASDDTENLPAQVSELQNQVADLRHLLEGKEQETEGIKMQLDAALVERDQLRKQVSSGGGAAEQSELEVELNELKEEFEELKRSSRQQEEELDRANKEKWDRSKEVVDLKGERKKDKELIMKLQKEIDEKKEQLLKKEEKIDQSLEKINEHAREIREIEELVEKEKKTAKQHQTEKDTALREVEVLNKRLANQEKEYKKLDYELRRTRRILNEYQNHWLGSKIKVDLEKIDQEAEKDSKSAKK